MSLKAVAGSIGGGGGGATEFKQLSDAPSSYSGQKGQVPRVKTDESGLEFRSFFRIAKFYDEANGSPSTGLAAPALAGMPYTGGAVVGDDIFFGSPNTPADSGVWTIESITYGTPGDWTTASATLTRRSDSVNGQHWFSGEWVFTWYDSLPHFVGVSDDNGNALLSGALDGSTITVYSTDFVTGNTLRTAVAQLDTVLDVKLIGARQTREGVMLVTDTSNPYDTINTGNSPNIVLIDATNGDVTLTLDLASVDTVHGLAAPITVKRIDGSSHTVTIDGGASIDGGAHTMTLAALQKVRFVLQSPGVPWLNGGDPVWWTV
jgi:hypothetical protein